MRIAMELVKEGSSKFPSKDRPKKSYIQRRYPKSIAASTDETSGKEDREKMFADMDRDKDDVVGLQDLEAFFNRYQLVCVRTNL